MTTAATDRSSTAREILGCELGAEVLRSFGELRLRATGASMLPALWPGDILSVRRPDALKALPGDVVLFERAGKLVAHRVVKKTFHQGKTHWITRGDSVEGNDAPVSIDELLGRVIAIERGSRRFPPQQSAPHRIAAWILSRSSLATRALLRIRDWTQAFRPMNSRGQNRGSQFEVGISAF